MSEYRTVFLDGTAVPTTAAGAAAIERLQAQLRQAKSDAEGLEGQNAALRSLREDATGGAERTPANARRAAADAHARMAQRISDAWKNPPNAGA